MYIRKGHIDGLYTRLSIFQRHLLLILVQEDKTFGFTTIESRASGNHWLIFSIIRSDVNSARVDRLRASWSLQRESQILWCVWGLALTAQLSLNPFRGPRGYDPECTGHCTWGAVQIPSGHRGPILTEPRLYHQSHSPSRIFTGKRSINSWLQNWFIPTEKPTQQHRHVFSLLISNYLHHYPAEKEVNIRRKIRSKSWINRISIVRANCGIAYFSRFDHSHILKTKIAHLFAPLVSFPRHPISAHTNYLSIQTIDLCSFWTRAAVSKNKTDTDFVNHQSNNDIVVCYMTHTHTYLLTLIWLAFEKRSGWLFSVTSHSGISLANLVLNLDS